MDGIHTLSTMVKERGQTVLVVLAVMEALLLAPVAALGAAVMATEGYVTSTILHGYTVAILTIFRLVDRAVLDAVAAALEVLVEEAEEDVVEEPDVVSTDVF